MKPEIILEIDAKGKNVSIEVKGVPGRHCMETTRFLEDALGEIACREFKSECFVARARTRDRIRTTRYGNPGSTDDTA